METIHMVDLIGQHAAIQKELNDAMQRVVQTGAFVKGPEVQAFSEELQAYTGSRFVIPCGNGTDALQIALMALGIGPGDEVITTGFTFISTIEVVALLGATPVLVDVHADTFNINVEQIAAAITPKTKAIVPVHLFGQMADMDALSVLSETSGIPLVEDNAQAISARWYGAQGTQENAPQSGTIGLMGTTSFFPSKNLGCMGDGGAIMTNDAHMAQKLQRIANHGMSKRYHHDVVGMNSRLDGLQAAILRVKLRYLPTYCAARQLAASRYDAALKDIPGIQTPFRDTRSSHVFHQYTIQVEPGRRNQLVDHLKANGIPTGVYYPIPGHRQTAFDSFQFPDAFPVTDSLSKRVVSLPMHTELNESQQASITEALIKFVKQ